MTFDPFALDDASETAGLRESSLLDRARKRSVAARDDHWVVLGEKRFGDSQRSYRVRFDPESRKYDCDCYYTTHGDSRRRRMCSHVLAVVHWRRSRPPDEAWVTPTPFPVAESPSAHQHPGGDGETGESGSTLSLFDDPASGDGEDKATDTGAEVAVFPVTLPDPRDAIFGTPGIPEWVTEFRPHQWQAVEEIVDAYESGAEVVWLDAPTGSGKTLIAEAARRILRLRASYICTSLSLQDQFKHDYDYACVLKGRNNYPTTSKPFPEFTCGDCTKNPSDGDDAECMWCYDVRACPYEQAKSAALRSPLAVVNTAYFLAEANYVGNLSGRDLVIVDECDVLEQELMGFVEYNLGERALSDLKITEPKKGSHRTTIAQWMEEELSVAVKARAHQIGPRPSSVQDIRSLQRLQRLYQDTLRVASELDSANWIRDNDAGPLVLKPVKVDAYGMTNLWNHGKKWLGMSATIISPEELSDSLGLTLPWRTVRVPMTFPVENRMIHLAPVAQMTAKNEEQAYPVMALAIRGVMRRHPEDRILVHTVSYKLTRYLRDQLRDEGRPLVAYMNAGERAAALERYRRTPGAVLLAPSMDRGIDLKHDDCRVVVVAKVPFPYLGDRQVGERLRADGGQAWYNVQTVRTLVQMTGRGVRSSDDWCVTYILDGQFVKNIYRKSRHLLPSWWSEALDPRFPTRELLRTGD